MRRDAAVLAASRWLFGASCVQILVELACKLFPLESLGVQSPVVFAAAVVLGAPYAVAAAYSRRLSRMRAAAVADDRLGLKCRLSAAAAMEAAGCGGLGDAAIEAAFLEEARPIAAGAEVSRAFPFRLPRIFFLAAIPLAAAAAVRSVLPKYGLLGKATRSSGTEGTMGAEERNRLAQKFEGRIEDLKKKIEKEEAAGGETPRHEGRIELARKMENLVRDIKGGEKDRREALVEMGDLRRKLDAERRAEAARDGMRRTAESLSRFARENGSSDPEAAGMAEEMAARMRNGDAKGAADGLRRLEKPIEKAMENAAKGDTAELERLRERLGRLAEALAEARGKEGPMDEMADLAGDIGRMAGEGGRLDDAAKREVLAKMHRLLAEARAGIEKAGERGDSNDAGMDEGEEDAAEEDDDEGEEKGGGGTDALDEMERMLDELESEVIGGSAGCAGEGKGGGKSSGGSKKGGKKKGGGSKKSAGSKRDGGGKGEGGKGAAGEGDGAGDGSGGKPGGRGIGGGGAAPERDSPADFERTKVEGRTGPGKITSLRRFRGGGEKNRAPEDFAGIAERAKQESAAALERERIPADARETVKKYFDRMGGGAGDGGE